MSEVLVLDTCALIWLAKGDRNLTSSGRRRIDAAARVCVSAISAWEIGLKSVRGKIDLPDEPEAWFGRVAEHHRIEVVDVSPRIAFAANRLDWHHRDPADRLIIATAIVEQAAIVTSDERFPAYGLEVIC